jgi:hypothetical protein
MNGVILIPQAPILLLCSAAVNFAIANENFPKFVCSKLTHQKKEQLSYLI